MHKLNILGFLVLFIPLTANAQNHRISGILVDADDRQPIIGAFITACNLKDTTECVSITSDTNGKFTISGLRKTGYRLTIQSISYTRFTQNITVTQAMTSLDTIGLAVDRKVLKEVVVVGQGTAVQKGDTTIMAASAFKVNPDANAEDLVKKMPGIVVENGTVKAHGEEIKNVLVDGKPFFGDDPSVALRNLPADVIDRVQVYNKLSDQAELTGFDDGSSSKTLNILTRKDSKISKFGKFTGGTNFSDKYLVAGSLNLFKGPRRLTFTGMSNDVNMQNFAMQDLLGSTGGGRGWHGNRGGMGGGFFGSSGITRNSSLGMNYTDNWGKKIEVTGSYFFNTTANTLFQESNTEYLYIEDGNLSSSNRESESKNYNHRINFRIEYVIDTMNTIVIVPRLSLQDNDVDNQSVYTTTGGVVNTQTINSSRSESNGLNFGNDITWRHKFSKKGRTLSIRSSVNQNTRNSENVENAVTDSIPDNQSADGRTSSLSLNTNVNYTEPVGKYSLLQLNFNNNFNRNNTDRETFSIGAESEVLHRLDSLSNVFDNDYITNRGGISYLYKKEDLSISTGLNYQQADLSGNQTFPQELKVNKSFRNLLPEMRITYKISEMTNMRFFYRTSTYAPSVNQLQNVIDNSNRLSISTGNPELRQEYSHRIMTNLAYANPTTGFNAFVFFSGEYTTDVIGNKTIYAKGDSTYLPDYDLILIPGGQLTYPVNLDHEVSIRSFINLAYFIKPIKSNLNFVVGGSYSQTPGFIDDLLNRPNAYNLTNSLILTSNISPNLDFTLSYTSNYSIVRNTASMEDLSDTRYWYQSASGKLNLILPLGFVFNTDCLYQQNRGLSGDYNQSYFVWNASAGKKFLKSQAAEIKLGIYDILNQNNSINRTVTASSISDTRTNTFQRYFLVLFTYNLRSKQGQPGAEQQQEHRHDDFPRGPGFGPGGPPRDFHPH